MDDIKERQLAALREAYETDARIKEMQAARDRQAAEWRKMINLAMARRAALQKRIASLGIAVTVAELPAPDDGGEDKAEQTEDDE